MDMRSRREQLRQADQVRELLAVVRGVVEGTATRQELVDLTRTMWPGDRQGSPFRGHGVAATVFDAAWNALQPEGAGYFVRDSDLACYARWLTEGIPARIDRPLCRARLTAPQIAARLGLGTVRYYEDGVGPQESVSFASLATGRPFLATSAWWTGAPSEAWIGTTESGDLGQALEDLFETLEIDADDVVGPIETGGARWEVWRQDDNGNRVRIAEFSGVALARGSSNHRDGLGTACPRT